MTTETQDQATDKSQIAANYLSLRPWVFGLLVFLVANMLCIYM